MKIRVHDINWGRVKRLPKEETMELEGDWFDWFSTDEKTTLLTNEIRFNLMLKYGREPKFFMCTGADVIEELQ